MLESPIVKEQFVIGTDTVFDFGVKIFDPADVSCYVFDPDTSTEYQLNSGTDFSVGLKPGTTDYENGARITLLTEQPANGKLTIIRSVVPAQRVALPNFGKIPSESLETQLDQNTAAVQQLTEIVKLCYKIPYGQSGTLTPLDSIRDIISGMGGGGGGGGAITWVESAGYAEALDSNFVVRSATFATSAQYLGGATKAQILASASSSTVNSATYATSATRVGGATKAQLLASASSSTVTSATYGVSATYLGGATKQQIIDSATTGGGDGVIPQWGSLIYDGDNPTLETGTTYITDNAGVLRISLRDVPTTSTDGCLRIYINGSSIGLCQIRSNTPGMTWFLTLPANTSFNVGSVSGANILVMFDRGVHTID